MNLPNGWELILVLLVVVLVFGSKRLPDSARALGRSMRILKAETKGLRDDDTPAPSTSAHVVQPVAPPQPVQAQPVQAQPVPPQPVQAPVPPQPVQAQPPAAAPAPYAGQPLFDAAGRPVQPPAGGSQPVHQAPHPRA